MKFLILKLFSINIIYKYTFFKFLKKAHLSKNFFILSIVYPSLKFKKQALPKFYSAKINNLSIKINEKNISENLYTKNVPDPEILIRTGNRKRLSNFLLWQISYTEIYFVNKLWPDFTRKDFSNIIKNFSKVKRNFGGVK